MSRVHSRDALIPTEREATFRFVCPDANWRKIAGWRRGDWAGILMWNPRCVVLLGFQWWDYGACIHFLNLSFGWGSIEKVNANPTPGASHE